MYMCMTFKQVRHASITIIKRHFYFITHVLYHTMYFDLMNAAVLRGITLTKITVKFKCFFSYMYRHKIQKGNRVLAEKGRAVQCTMYMQLNIVKTLLLRTVVQRKIIQITTENLKYMYICTFL